MPTWARALFVSLCLLSSSVAVGCAGGGLPSTTAVETAPRYVAHESALTLAHLQLKGSHNSYHRAPWLALARSWRYSHAPLEEQLRTQGVRHLELDVRYEKGEIRIAHLPLVDGRSNCKTLRGCLGQLKRWSRKHPGHLPVFVFIEPKENMSPSHLDGRIDALDASITRVFSRDSLLVPSQVAGNYPSLSAAVRAKGFPSIESSRGKFAFVLFGKRKHQRAYAKDNPRLDGRVMFVAGTLDQPHTAVLSVDDPIRHGDVIARAVREGFLVRTRADADLVQDKRRRRVALQSGAHFVSSDFVDPRHGWVEMGDRAPVRCNPVTAPRSCARAGLGEIETLLWAQLTEPLARD